MDVRPMSKCSMLHGEQQASSLLATGESPAASSKNLSRFSPQYSDTSIYKSLQHVTNVIRLVTIDMKINPCLEKSIHCQLVEVDLATNPTYYAISYEWDYKSSDYEHESGPKEIFVNGQAKIIMDNLYQALVRFSQQPVPGLNQSSDEADIPFFWIDNLCINQEDICERNHQVGLMGRIYSEAECVLVWLGRERYSPQSLNHYYWSGNSTSSAGFNDRVMAILEQIPDIPDSSVSEFVLEMLGPEKSLGDHWPVAIESWCNRSYWNRMWITQEVHLARRLHIYTATSQMAWSSLTKARHYFMKRPLHTQIHRWTAFTLDENREQKAKWTLRQLMILRRNAKCTDSRDKVYALLALAIDTKGRLAVDYSRDISALYREVMKLYMTPSGAILSSLTSDLVAFSSFLQKRLGPLLDGQPSEHDMVQLTDDDIDPVWVCGYFIGVVKLFKSQHIECPGPNSSLPVQRRTICTAVPAVMKKVAEREQLIWTRYSNFEQSPIRERATQSQAKPRLFQFKPGGLTRKRIQAYYQCGIVVKYNLEQQQHASWDVVKGPQDARDGDMVCGFPGSDIALVFRMDTESVKLRLIGKATMNKRMLTTDEVQNNTANPPPKDASTLKAIPERAVFMRLQLGVLQLLTSPEQHPRSKVSLLNGTTVIHAQKSQVPRIKEVSLPQETRSCATLQPNQVLSPTMTGGATTISKNMVERVMVIRSATARKLSVSISCRFPVAAGKKREKPPEPTTQNVLDRLISQLFVLLSILFSQPTIIAVFESTVNLVKRVWDLIVRDCVDTLNLGMPGYFIASYLLFGYSFIGITLMARLC